MKNSSDFSQFTNLYSLSKTLRFELKPTESTQKMLEDNKVFEKDGLIQKKYIKTKKYFDELHREFVKEALENAKLSNLDNYYSALKEVKNINKDSLSKEKKSLEKILENEEKKLRKEVVALFNAKAEEWSKKYKGLKNKDIKILDEEAVFQSILKVKYNDDKDAKETDEKGEEVSIFDGWKGFTGYFTKFFETRKNFYKDDGTSTALATRIIDQNLKRFVDNIEIIKFIQRNYPDFSFEKYISEYASNLEDVCDLNFYVSNCLLQNGIDEYNKNFVGKIKFKINEYRQKNKVKIPYLKTLDNQILSEREKFIEEIANDEELKKELEDLFQTGKEKVKNLKNLFDKFFNQQERFDISNIYLSKKGFETISRKWANETVLWETSLADSFKEYGIKLTKKKDKGYSFPDYISLQIIKKSLFLIKDTNNIKFWKEKYGLDENQDVWEQFLQILKQEFDGLFEKNIRTDKGDKNIGYNIYSKELEGLLRLESVKGNTKYKVVIKQFADSLISFYQFSKYFAVEKNKIWDDDVDIDAEFYNHIEYGFKDVYYYDCMDRIIKPYNLLRNYLTKKPWEDAQKMKLNFENSTLADGWDKNKETDNWAVILRKDRKYYLGLMKKGNNKIFCDKNIELFEKDIESGKYDKMTYKLLPGPNKMLPKVFFSKSNIDFFNPSDEILRIRNHSSHTKGGEPQKGFEKHAFNLNDCHKLIDFFKESLNKHNEWKDFNFTFSETGIYKDVSDFYREVEKGGYKISWQDVSEKYIGEKNDQGELYLFQIKNKDWNKGAIGTKNLHTLYFESIFSAENEKNNFIFKLNGQAEIFHRPKAIEINKVKRNFKRELVEKKRYTRNKVFFHIPITINRNENDLSKFAFNQKLNKFLANNQDINIIGVDRGEKHLAYYSIINQNEEILDSGSLNYVGKGKDDKPIDYHKKLEEKAINREQARKDWEKVEGIKDLKKGYISQVVRKLADLAIEYNAIIVFEDLNMRFKQIRGGIEKSIYQQLEKALIDKLNFLVNKGEKDFEKAGNLLKAYQLADPFTTFKEMGKQTGIIFYTQASYTSKIDPMTGWRPNLYLKYSNAEKAKKDILNFKKIIFNESKGYFEFIYDLKDFVKDTNAKIPKKTEWTLCSCVERFYWDRKLNNNKGGYKYYENLTKDFKKLFEGFNIDYQNNDILKQIEEMEVKGNGSFFREYIFLFKLLCQIRNTNDKENGDDNDFIFSPVDPFFDSRKENGKHLPKNGDDNGAYNIARKGLILLDRINDFDNLLELEKAKLKSKFPDLFIPNVNWDNFVQK